MSTSAKASVTSLVCPYGSSSALPDSEWCKLEDSRAGSRPAGFCGVVSDVWVILVSEGQRSCSDIQRPTDGPATRSEAGFGFSRWSFNGRGYKPKKGLTLGNL
jgi:hypothetical protein